MAHNRALFTEAMRPLLQRLSPEERASLVDLVRKMAAGKKRRR